MNDELADFLPSVSEEPEASDQAKVIRLQCPNCDREYKLGSDKAGKRVKCKDCETLITVPGGTPKKRRPKPAPAQTTSAAASEEESDLKKIWTILVLVVSVSFGVYRLVIEPIIQSSRYNEADRLTAESIDLMNQTVDAIEAGKPSSKIDQLGERLKAITARMLSLKPKLSNSSRRKLYEKHNASLTAAKNRFDRLMSKSLRDLQSVLSKAKAAQRAPNRGR